MEADISTLRKTGHFYFALTRRETRRETALRATSKRVNRDSCFSDTLRRRVHFPHRMEIRSRCAAKHATGWYSGVLICGNPHGTMLTSLPIRSHSCYFCPETSWGRIYQSIAAERREMDSYFQSF